MNTKSLLSYFRAILAVMIASPGQAAIPGDPPPPVGTPLHLKFTTIRGKHVDLASLKGKVVLIDFWATWCHPCVDEVPNIVAAYQKLHRKGLEILGVTLDNDKALVAQFIKDHHMPWEEYCDRRGGANPVAGQYGINSLPTMWLVDKEGKMANTNARGNLEAEVERLLGQP